MPEDITNAVKDGLDAYFAREDDLVELALPGDGGQWVKIKRRLSTGDYEGIGLALRKDGLIPSEQTITASRLLAQTIKAWSFDLPITLENIGSLRPEITTYLAEEIKRLDATRTEEERAPLSLPSSNISDSARRSRRHAPQG